MRITGGKARGIPLKVPPGDGTRPTTDRLRQAVFSSLGGIIEHAIVLDLFAGTGAYGLEALSRGAQCAYFVEKHPKVLPYLRTNLEHVLKSADRSKDCAQIMQADALDWRPPAHIQFDLIFIDPPYAIWPNIADRLLTCFYPSVKSGSWLMIEYLKSYPPPIPSIYYIHKNLGTGKNPHIMMLQPQTKVS